MLADHPVLDDRRLHLLMGILIVAVSGLTAARTYRNWSPPATEFNWQMRGHSDFHYGTYLPTRAFGNGDSPYTMDVCEKYRMPRPVPAFSPATFVYHLPFSLLPLRAANVAFFVYNWLLMAGLAWLTVHMVSPRFRWGIFLAAWLLLLLSRPGHQTLFTGYFTAELAIGTLLAMHYSKSRPWLAAIGLLLTSFKPNFCVPLILLLTCRRDYRAVIGGIVLCGMGVLLGIGWLSTFSSPMEVLQGIIQGQESHEANPAIDPANTWVRTDLVGIISKPLGTAPNLLVYLLTMVPMIALPGWWLWKRGAEDRPGSAIDTSGMLIGLTMMVAFYHSIYDALFLIAPWFAAAFFGNRFLPELSWRQRCMLVILTAVPAVNYLSTLSGRKLLGLSPESVAWQWLSVSSGLALLIALILLLFWLYRIPDPARTDARQQLEST